MCFQCNGHDKIMYDSWYRQTCVVNYSEEMLVTMRMKMVEVVMATNGGDILSSLVFPG